MIKIIAVSKAFNLFNNYLRALLLLLPFLKNTTIFTTCFSYPVTFKLHIFHYLPMYFCISRKRSLSLSLLWWCFFHRAAGGGLVAKSCPTLVIPWPYIGGSDSSEGEGKWTCCWECYSGTSTGWHTPSGRGGCWHHVTCHVLRSASLPSVLRSLETLRVH